MPRSGIIKGRNVKGGYLVNGEMLFAPGGPVPGWTRDFSNKLTGAVRRAAPSNKRPRWGHYGEPLKLSFTSKSKSNPLAMRADAVVASRVAHALYVDQGTGVHGGNGPYFAKILPPWSVGSPTLYDHAWVPPGSTKPIGPVLINGQKGQHFFERGMEEGFALMRMASGTVPTGGVMASALDAFPTSLEKITGGTSGPGFKASLEEWRSWRDAAFAAGDGFDTPGSIRGPRDNNGVKPGGRQKKSDWAKEAYRANEEAKSREKRRAAGIEEDPEPKWSRKYRRNPKAGSVAAQKVAFIHTAWKAARKRHGSVWRTGVLDGRFYADIIVSGEDGYHRIFRKIKT